MTIFEIVRKLKKKKINLNDERVSAMLFVSNDSVFFSCCLCTDEFGIDYLSEENLPLVICKSCEKSVSVLALYDKQFIKGSLS